MEISKKPVLLEVVRRHIRLKRYSHWTEKPYTNCVKRLKRFHHKQHPKTPGKPEIESFLTHLPVHRKISATTQNRSFNALEACPQLEITALSPVGLNFADLEYSLGSVDICLSEEI